MCHCFVSVSMASRSSRRSFTFKEKAQIISRLKNGENNGALCKEFKVPHSTISAMWKNRDVILECFDTKSLKVKRNRKSAHQDVENALLKWFRDQRSQQMISGRILQEKANYFARMLGKDFECSEGWIYRFRHRYDISVGKVCGAALAARVSRDECENLLESDKWQESRRGRKRTQLEKVPASDFDTNSRNGQLGDHASQTTSYQDALVRSIKIESNCCFCGEVQKDFFDVVDKPYVELASKKTILTLNDLSIELDFNEDSTRRNVCQNCDTRLKGITDFIKVVKNAQDKLRHVTEVDDLKGLDTLNERSYNYDGENNGFNHDSNNKAHENHNNRKIYTISDTEFVKEAHKRKNYEQENSDLPKKRSVSFNLNCLAPSLCQDDEESDMDNNEIKYEVDNNNEIDPLAVTDRHVKEVLAYRSMEEFTKNGHENNGSIEIKDEINEMTDALDDEAQKQDTGTKMQPFEVHGTEALASEVTCRKADKMNKLDNEVNNSDIVNELSCESETLGAMPRSEFILLVRSIVRQMIDK